MGQRVSGKGWLVQLCPIVAPAHPYPEMVKSGTTRSPGQQGNTAWKPKWGTWLPSGKLYFSNKKSRTVTPPIVRAGQLHYSCLVGNWI